MIDYSQFSSAKDRFVCRANSVQFVDDVVAACNQLKWLLLLFVDGDDDDDDILDFSKLVLYIL